MSSLERLENYKIFSEHPGKLEPKWGYCLYNLTMHLTPYTEVNGIIRELLHGIKSILGSKLVGLYLGGSLVLGDFDPNNSDIDLTAAISTFIDENEYEALRDMHEKLAAEHSMWDDRIEVCYITIEALQTVRTLTSQIVNISPDEPFHRTESCKEWLLSWYMIRENGKTLFGPPPKEIIEPISKEEFIQSVIDNARSWDRWVLGMENRYGQSFAILSMCRALYSYRTGDQTSKKAAGIWAQKELPEWSGFIQEVIDWKEAGRSAGADEKLDPRTIEFVRLVRSLILAGQ